jgi:hypothetical protein
MPETSKRIKRFVREYAAIAHDRELGQALRDLDVQFGRWRNGEISAAELNDVIHQFHDGASREVWRRYATNRPEAALGFAVATGILRKEELPAELLQHLAGFIDFYQAEQSA